MATLERPSLADDGGAVIPLTPSIPTPFPSDELDALRSSETLPPRPKEFSLSSLDAPPSSDGHLLPPGYDEDDDETNAFLDPHHPHHLPPPSLDDVHHHVPPTYPHDERASFHDHEDYPTEKPAATTTSSSASSSEEKRRLDLDSVTAAISRLYDVAPQMGDQRVELNARKRDEMDLARLIGGGAKGKMTESSSSSKGKPRESKEEELGQIWERIEQAHGRRLAGQEAEMRPSASASARKERDFKKQAFMEGVADRTSAGRMHGQDSAPPSLAAASSSSSSSTTATKEQQDLITVGQFIRELGSESNTLLPSSPTPTNRRSSLPQILTSPSTTTPPPTTSTPPTSSSKRSSFVPAFVEAALQRRASIKNGPSQDSLPDVASSSTRRRPRQLSGYRYLAEFQESIRVVQVHVELPREEVPVGTELEIVVVEGEEQEKEVRIRSSSSSSSLSWEIKIHLPASALPHSSKFITSSPSSSSSSSPSISFRLPTPPPSSDSTSPSSTSTSQPQPPLSAPHLSHLSHLSPTSLSCSTCLTPIILTSLLPSSAYKDLPSEHWEELVGSWLCHDEMKLALGGEGEEGGGKGGGGGGFWPRKWEVLVGENYVLVGGGLMGEGCWRVRRGGESETWQPIDCSTCSSPLGRKFNHPSVPPTSTFKIQKYAITPTVAASAASPPPPPTFPLSVYIASDLLELADVHRCYHFVVYSEEEPLVPLILIWLLNPSLQITLGSTTSSSRGPFRAAKVMFQTSPSLLSPLPPSFDAAEPLHYPSSICTKLANELESSHAAYPGRSGDGMMGLKGGWLERW